MIDIKRPGDGLAPIFIEEIVGKRAKKDIKKDDIILWDAITRGE
jgi:sialic acid synthase SpsE